MPQVDQDLASLGLQEQGIGYAPQSFLRHCYIFLLEGIAA